MASITNSLIDTLEQLALCLRLGQQAKANSLFIQFTEQLSQTTDLPVTAELSNLLQVMMLAQQRKDYLFVADILNYELKPLLLTSQAITEHQQT